MKKYDDEFKQQAVKKILDGQSVASVSRELGVGEGLLHKWKKRKIESSSETEKEVLELRKRLREVETERDILKKGGTYLRQGRLERYRFIEKQAGEFPVKILCRVMRVSRAAFYAYRSGLAHCGTEAQTACREAVKECFYEHRRRDGSRRIAKQLKIGRCRARSAMKREHLRAIARRRFRPRTTDSGHDAPVSPNLLRGDATNQPVDKAAGIVGDITYLPLSTGKFCYPAVFQDTFTRRIVGWAVSNRMTAQIVIDALRMALRRGLLKRGAIIHSDRGSQYAAVEYRRLLYINGFRQSMSRRGNCYDNAMAESFFSRFKSELVEGGLFESVEQAKSKVFSYIEGYYNRVRSHSSLGYLSPIEFEKQLNLKTTKRRESFVSWKS